MLECMPPHLPVTKGGGADPPPQFYPPLVNTQFFENVSMLTGSE